MLRRNSGSTREFCWADVLCHDLESTRKFYGELMGWGWESMDTGTGPAYGRFLVRGERVAGLGIMPPQMQVQGIAPFWQSYIAVPDVAGTLAQAEQLGAAITQPALRISDSGWLGSIQDPAGAHLCFWQAGQDPGAGLIGEPGTMCWHEITTRDPQRTMEFYGHLFGWEFSPLAESSPHYFRMRCHNKHFGGVLKLDEREQAFPAWAVYFQVVDLADTLARTAELGGRIVVPVFETTIGISAIIGDPQGARVHLVQRTGATA